MISIVNCNSKFPNVAFRYLKTLVFFYFCNKFIAYRIPKMLKNAIDCFYIFIISNDSMYALKVYYNRKCSHYFYFIMFADAK